MLGIELTANAYLERLSNEVGRVSQPDLQMWADLIYDAWQRENFVFLFGNGGSGCTASHMAEDLGKSLLPEAELQDDSKKRLKVMSLTDNVGWILAVGNDLSYDEIFVQQLKNFARREDLVIAISGSGNSPNVIKAVEWANGNGLVTFGLTGYDGGKLKQIQTHGLHVDLPDMGMVESIHLCLYHWVLNDVFARVNKQGRYA